MAALKADYDIRLLGEPVDNLAFSLVAPLGADDDHVRQSDASKSAAHNRNPGTGKRRGGSESW